MKELQLAKAVNKADIKTVKKAGKYRKKGANPKTVNGLLYVVLVLFISFTVIMGLDHMEIVAFRFLSPEEFTTVQTTQAPQGYTPPETVTVINDIPPVTTPPILEEPDKIKTGDFEADTVFAPIPDAQNCTVRRIARSELNNLLSTLFPNGGSDELITLSQTDAELYIGGNAVAFRQYDGGISLSLIYGTVKHITPLTFYAAETDSGLDCVMFFEQNGALTGIHYDVTNESGRKAVTAGCAFFEAYNKS